VADELNLLMIPCKHQKRLGKQGVIHCNQHSGFQIINIAYFLGAKKIILLGYDMQVKDVNKIHWFGNHPKGLRNTPNKYTGWILHYDNLENDLKEEGVDIVNCTIDTAIKKIRKGKLEEELL
jgi:hypothetical protein